MKHPDRVNAMATVAANFRLSRNEGSDFLLHSLCRRPSDSVSRNQQKSRILAGALVSRVADNLPQIVDFLANLQI